MQPISWSTVPDDAVLLLPGGHWCYIGQTEDNVVSLEVGVVGAGMRWVGGVCYQDGVLCDTFVGQDVMR